WVIWTFPLTSSVPAPSWKESDPARRTAPAGSRSRPPRRAVRACHGGAARVVQLGAARRHGGDHGRRRLPRLAGWQLHAANGEARGAARAAGRPAPAGVALARSGNPGAARRDRAADDLPQRRERGHLPGARPARAAPPALRRVALRPRAGPAG